jgi:hypothetical protein
MLLIEIARNGGYRFGAVTALSQQSEKHRYKNHERQHQDCIQVYGNT